MSSAALIGALAIGGAGRITAAAKADEVLPDYHAAQRTRLESRDPRVEIYQDRHIRVTHEQSSWQGDFVSVYESLQPLRRTLFRVWEDGTRLWIDIQAHEPAAAVPNQPDAVRITIHPHFSRAAATHEIIVRSDDSPGTRRGGVELVRLEPQDSGWGARLAIPYASLRRAPPEPGSVWGLNVERIGQPGDFHSSWAPVRLAERDETWGWLHFTHEHSGDSFKRVSSIRPEAAELHYLSPQEKKLNLFVDIPSTKGRPRLFWRNPRNQSQELPLEAADIVHEDQQLTIHFRHPLPIRDGSYALELCWPDIGDSGSWLALHFDREALIRAGVRAERALTEKKPVTSSTEPPTLQMMPDDLERLLTIIPARSGLARSSDSRSPASVDGRLEWSPDAPFELTCSDTGLVFPHPDYPETTEVRAATLRGKEAAFPVYKNEEGDLFFITPFQWYRRLHYIIGLIPQLATDDPVAAATLLHRLATVYPDYTVVVHHSDLPSRTNGRLLVPGPPYPLRAAPLIDRRWNVTREVAALAETHRKLVNQNAYAAVTTNDDANPAATVEFGFIRPVVEFVRTYEIRGANREPYLLHRWARIGQALDEPDYLHAIAELVNRFVQQEFFFDGFYREVTISYHNQTARALQGAVGVVEAWRDPPGYRSPRTGRTFDQPDLQASMPVLGAAMNVRHELAFPDRQVVPVQETWGHVRGNAPAQGVPHLYPAAGLARLARGQTRYFAERDGDGLRDGGDQMHLYLNAPPKFARGKTHFDPLNLSLFAKGQELLPDLGYTRTAYRFAWARTTLAHNTVVVDSRDNNRVGNIFGGTYTLFAPVDDTLQIVAAHQRTYGRRSALPEYDRECWLVATGPEDAYILDLFRVEGGSRHEYTLGGASRHPSVMRTEVPLPYRRETLLPAGVTFREPRHATDTGFVEGSHYPAYAMVRELQYGPLMAGAYEVTLETQGEHVQLRRPSGDRDTRARLRILGHAASDHTDTLYIGRAPSLKLTRHRDGLGDSHADQFWMPKLVVRREAMKDETLRSEFVHLLEPYRYARRHGPGDWRPHDETPRVDAITVYRSADLDNAQTGDIAVHVRHGDYEDWLLSSPTADTPMAHAPWRFTGARAFIRLRAGEIERVTLIGGHQLDWADQTWPGKGIFTGQILATLRRDDGDEIDGFLIQGVVPPDAAGTYLKVEHPAGTRFGYSGTRSAGLGDARTHPLPYTRLYPIRSIDSTHPGTTLIETGLAPEFDLSADGGASLRFYPHLDWEPDVIHQGHIMFIDHAYAGKERDP